MKTYFYDTVVLGTGCAGYNCADWLKALGRKSVCMVTEGREMGTSRNTGSDKQTYYKLSLCGGDGDSVRDMADDLYGRGGVNGDTALCEAAGSVQSFMKLVNLGVGFPCNAYGEYVGYKTDHDPRQRATSAGPLTSKYMTQALERSVLHRGVEIYDGCTAVEILVQDGAVCGLCCLNKNTPDDELGLTVFYCKHLVMATGGEAGAYFHSVFPVSQTGANGLLHRAGVEFANLNQWQYGLASTKFRWNVSGSYQQVIPRYVSVTPDGEEHEFLQDAFPDPGQAMDMVFLKGYQWPFDVSKLAGSSRVDVLVQQETEKGNRVYMDFRTNPFGLADIFPFLGETAKTYLQNSAADGDTPLKRLQALNPRAIALYKDHQIDLCTQMLEVSVCAQHQNGGAAVDADWQTNIRGLYAVGEAAGTFGAYRPGGSALNSGQVGSMRAAHHIAFSSKEDIPAPACQEQLDALKEALQDLLTQKPGDATGHTRIRVAAQREMSAFAANRRSPAAMGELLEKLSTIAAQYPYIVWAKDPAELTGAMKTWDILRAQCALLRTEIFAAAELGSCGSALVLDEAGQPVFLPDTGHEDEILVTAKDECRFAPVRPLPNEDSWFETVWAEFSKRRGETER